MIKVATLPSQIHIDWNLDLVLDIANRSVSLHMAYFSTYVMKS